MVFLSSLSTPQGALHGVAPRSVIATFDPRPHAAADTYCAGSLCGAGAARAASGRGGRSELIEQASSATLRQLALPLAAIEGVTAGLAHLCAVLPLDEALYLSTPPNVIDNQGDKATG